MELRPGTRALVTGASRGIGRALAERLAARGARLGLLARSADELEALAAALPARGARPHVALPCDVTDGAAVDAAVARFVEEAGGLELLVANAGIADYAPFADQPVEAQERMLAVNVHGTLNTIRAGLPHLLDRAEGHVVIVSSGAGLRAFPWAAVYGATKAFGRGLGEALFHELSGTGVGLTTVFPGEVETALHDHERDRLPDWRDNDEAIPAHKAADQILRGIERDRRQVFTPPLVRMLGVVHGASPKAADAMLRRMRGPTAAPRRG